MGLAQQLWIISIAKRQPYNPIPQTSILQSFKAMSDLQPDPRFEEFEEVLDADGKAIGFRLEDNQFLFEYDEDGGWKDQKGNYYNSEGVCLEKQEKWDVDDKLVDQMEDLLLEQEGESEGEAERESEGEADDDSKPKQRSSIDLQLIEAIQKLKGTASKIKFFIRSRNSLQRQVVVVSGDNNNKINQSIRDSLDQINTNERCRIEKKLPKQFTIDFSYQDGLRYWFGQVQTTPENAVSTFDRLDSNKNFGVLKKKTLNFLRSIVLDQLATEQQAVLLKNMQKFSQGKQVVVTVSNLPPESPLSLVVDLAENVEVPLDTLYSVKLAEDSTAKIWTNLKSATMLTKLCGRNQEERLVVEVAQSDIDVLQKSNTYIIFMEKQSQFNPKSVLENILLIENSRDGYYKFPQKQVHINPKCLRRIIMYRGEDFLVPIALSLYHLP